MGNQIYKMFTQTKPEQLYIHIYNMRQMETFELSSEFTLNKQMLPNHVSNILKSINFKSAYDWDSLDGKIIIYMTINKNGKITHSYGYLMNFNDDNCKELDAYTIDLDYYFNNNPMFSLIKVLTNECTPFPVSGFEFVKGELPIMTDDNEFIAKDNTAIISVNT